MKKGKPKKEDSSLVIRDAKLDPFKIYFDGNCYTVSEDTDNNDRIIGYYSKMGQAIHSVVKQKMLEGYEYTLQEFIDKYQDNLETFTDIFEKHID